MADPRFFRKEAHALTLAELAQIADAEPGSNADPAASFTDVAALEAAGPTDVTFLDNRRYVEQFEQSRAGACVVAPKLADRAPAGMALLLTERPYRAYARIARAFYPERRHPADGVSSAAAVDASAEIGAGCSIAPGVVVEANAVLGARVRVGAGAVVGAGVTIGDDSTIGANATLSHCKIGRRANIHPGVRIGQRGFGFDMDPSGHLDVPQLGRVIVGDDVEIGANSTVDRGAGPDTVIGDGCKIDNLVQIGHNVRLGRGCTIVAHSGISGSVQFEDHAVMGGQAVIAGHLRIGSGAQIGAQAGVMRDVPAGARVVGTPAVNAREFFRRIAMLTRMVRAKD